MSVQEAERSLLCLPTSRIDGRCKETELTHIKRRLSKKKLAGQPSKTATPTPRRFLSPEIAKLTSQINDKLNPANFSQETHLAKTDPGYGTPQEGTLTAIRGRRAHKDICVEVVDLCQIIWDHATMTGNFDQEEDIACILFKDIFSLYSKISGNVVGLLQRARKYEVVQFEGETLFQGRDDLTPIFVLRNMNGVKQVFKPDSQNQWGVIKS